MHGAQDLVEEIESSFKLPVSRFNSGKFGVPWTDTEDVLKELGVGMTIYTPPVDE
jgi:ADP-ribose 1''-phosphate phosphatase